VTESKLKIGAKVIHSKMGLSGVIEENVEGWWLVRWAFNNICQPVRPSLLTYVKTIDDEMDDEADEAIAAYWEDMGRPGAATKAREGRSRADHSHAILVHYFRTLLESEA